MPKFVVRYGAMRSLGVFTVRGNEKLQRASQVIARTERGLEAGEVLAVATEESVEHLSHAPHGQILRRMTSEDLNEWLHIQAQTRQEFELCQRHVTELQLNMQLVDLERLFGGERMVVYYLSEERVDFRELVRRLASEFQTRIEMRQIGVRDEAKLLADYGDCGKPVCCNTHLTAMPPVSMKMAKLQKATLDPTKISGRCGRLKCCLRYEYDTYVDLQRELPPPGSDVVTREGRVRVLNQAILAQQLLVETEDHRRILIQADEILTVLRRGPQKSPSKKEKDGGRKKRRNDETDVE
jgi:cell fate regulator YaaT (PSP1 superfamily)